MNKEWKDRINKLKLKAGLVQKIIIIIKIKTRHVSHQGNHVKH